MARIKTAVESTGTNANSGDAQFYSKSNHFIQLYRKGTRTQIRFFGLDGDSRIDNSDLIDAFQDDPRLAQLMFSTEYVDAEYTTRNTEPKVNTKIDFAAMKAKLK